MTAKQSLSLSLSETDPKHFPQHDRAATPFSDEEAAMALAKLGSVYEKGIGVFTNYVNAYMWYFIAEHKGNTKAGLSRERIANKMTPAQVVKAQAMACQCLPSGDSSY